MEWRIIIQEFSASVLWVELASVYVIFMAFKWYPPSDKVPKKFTFRLKYVFLKIGLAVLKKKK